MMVETFKARLNGEKKEVRIFQINERVRNKHGDTGTVKSTEDSPMFVHVDWDKNDSSYELQIGARWLATSLFII